MKCNNCKTNNWGKACITCFQKDLENERREGAVQQLKFLEDWIRKEIQIGINAQKHFSKLDDDESGIIWTSRVETLNEVLNKLESEKK